MTKFAGQVSNTPERWDGDWYFSIWNTKEERGINCVRSARFKAERFFARFHIQGKPVWRCLEVGPGHPRTYSPGGDAARVQFCRPLLRARVLPATQSVGV
jgi:hypothetical protein